MGNQLKMFAINWTFIQMFKDVLRDGLYEQQLIIHNIQLKEVILIH